MTVVENISWSGLLKNTNLTAEHGNDGNHIAMATETLKQAAHQFAQVLNERARLFANSAQFDTALRDAAAIRALLPGSGLGYLCTGDVHCQQGRYAAAISIYDQGLEAAPESDPYYQQLQQQRMTAVSNNSKRVDFISRLPLDIVITNIVPRMERPVYLDSIVLYEPLYVSRTWQARFLQRPNGLDFDFGQDGINLKRDHDQLVRFAPYVRSLSGSLYDDNCLDDLLSRAHFSNLKRLVLYCDAPPHRALIKGLQLIGDSLTHLVIEGSPIDVGLHGILESCPNLVSLDVERVEAAMSSPVSSRYPKITHLALDDLPDGPPSQDDVIDILSRLPSLLSFQITPMPGSGVLTILHEHCPYLQKLDYGYPNDASFKYHLQKIELHPNRKGITSAHLGYEGFDYVQDDLIQFLHLHRHTLETIQFGCRSIDSSNCRWRLQNGHVVSQARHHRRYLPTSLLPENDPTQTKTIFTRLVNVDFSLCDPSSSCGFMLWLISNGPNLKAIHLTESHFLPDVSNAIIKMSNLSKLEITKIAGTAEFYDPIISFMQHHVAMEDRSTLKGIILHIDDGAMHAVTWLNLISRMKHLKDLKLLTGTIPEISLPALEKIGQGCSSLESLTLGDTYFRYVYFTDGVIKSLCQHPKLKCLTINAKSLSAADFFALSSFPSLERLRLYCDIPPLAKDMLRNLIPNAIIV
ncbi:hypothetical protein O0I10_011984 [Lichtheimia ornata]|uniref:Uncharacterized protein n=1 Tax=Lichtheimia ornata TaxID=688661 RepID=A0AAD7URU9_9FUNG|nr:uncharacterized protein O0I10_011984 [Lichtheimia ornata]KAJ8652404.1 hypothetical protein O0I10_011984 [Lichtheimia ornata]